MNDLYRSIVVLLFLAIANLASGAEPAAPDAALDAAIKTITEADAKAEPLAIYDAFQSLPKLADTPVRQARAFVALAPYLGRNDMKIFVPHPPGSQLRSAGKHFSHAALAEEAIYKLGEPARGGLVKTLDTESLAAAQHAAVILAAIDQRAKYYQNEPPRKKSSKDSSKDPAQDYRLLTADERTRLEAFIKQHDTALSVYTLNELYRAGFATALESIHRVLQTADDVSVKRSAAFWLNKHAHEPALDDLIEIMLTHPNAHFRSIASDLQNFPDTDRTTKALEQALAQESDKDVRYTMEVHLGNIHSKAKAKTKAKN